MNTITAIGVIIAFVISSTLAVASFSVKDDEAAQRFITLAIYFLLLAIFGVISS